MTKYIALKAYRGLEGHVRVGQVLAVVDFPTLDASRIDDLTRLGLIGVYSDKMAASPRNQAVRSPQDPPGLDSPNAGGMRSLGWTPGEADEGNGQGAEGAPDGSSTSAAISSSSLQAAPAQGRPTSPAPKPGRVPRGTRSAS